MEIGTTEAAPHRLPSPARAWWTVAVLTALYALSLMDRQIIALVVNDIRRDLGISDFAVGLLNGLAFALFYVTFGLIFGWASDRYSRRGLIAGGLALWSVATATCGLARTMPQLLLSRFAVGAGEGALNPSAFSLIADCFPRERLSTATSVYGAGSHLGASMSLLVGGLVLAAIPSSGLALPLLGTVAPWRAVFLLLGLPGLLAVLIAWTIAEPPRRGAATRAEKAGFVATLRVMRKKWRFYLGHNLGFALMMAGAYGYAAWSPTFLIRNLHVPIATIGMQMAFLSICFGMTGAVIAGYVVDRFFAGGTRDAHLRTFMYLAWVQLAALIWIANATSLVQFVMGSAVFIGTSSYPGVAAAALQIVAPTESRGQISALYLSATGLLGPGIGPVLVGVFTTFVYANDSYVGWSIASSGMVLLPLASLCFWFALKPMRDHFEEEDIAAA